MINNIKNSFSEIFIFNLTAFTACLVILSVNACSKNVYSYNKLIVSIPEGINISKDELHGRFAPLKLVDGSAYTLKITVYGYSQGAEIISFSSGDEFSTRKGKAWIKALIQVINGDEIVMAYIIEVSGNGREELLDTFASRVQEKISGAGR